MIDGLIIIIIGIVVVGNFGFLFVGWAASEIYDDTNTLKIICSTTKIKKFTWLLVARASSYWVWVRWCCHHDAWHVYVCIVHACLLVVLQLAPTGVVVLFSLLFGV